MKRVMEGTIYPATKSVLLEKLELRLVKVEEGKHARLNELLNEVSSKHYRSAEEVVQEVKLQ